MKLDQAKKKVQRFKDTFADQYGEGHYIFACHAAFPVGFTPDMLYQIWANFRGYPLEDAVDSPTLESDLIAVSDLLLSPLCKKTGRDLYEMDVKVRAVLLDELRNERFARVDRLNELAYFIFQYLDSIVAQYEYDSFRETLYWNTLVTISPQQAFQEVTQKLGEYIKENNEGEIMRMRNLLESFAYQDQGLEKMESSNFGKLLSYTKALKASMLEYPTSVINQQIKESGAIAFTSDPAQAQGSIEIPLLEGMVGKVDMPEADQGDYEEPPLPTKEVFALTIGIDEYIYPSMILNGCLNDMNLVNAYLEEAIDEGHDYKLELTSLTNEKATSKNVKETLAQFKKEAGPEDIVFFYFAGHSVKDSAGLDYTSLILHDTRIEWEDQKVTKVDEFKLETLVADGWACDLVLFIDTHYSAAILPNTYDHIIFFAACGIDQQAFEHRIGKRTNGLFTFNIIKTLRESKQRLTYHQLFQQLRVQMNDSGYDQSPVLIANQQHTYKYFLGDYAPKSEELFNRIEAARSEESPELDLSNLGISFIPPEVFGLDFLQSINLSGNQIDGIPTKLNSLRKLERLDLRNNQITRINLDVLAKRSLKEIFLSGNPITDIPEELLDGDAKRLLNYLDEIKKDARNLFALFIGIDEYPQFQDSESIKLRAAVSDAKALRKTLKAHFQTDRELNFQRRDLYNEDATKENIIQAISNFVSQAEENDVFLCYFAGHDTNLKTGEAAWVLTDSTGDFDGATELTASDLSTQVQSLLNKNVNTILLNPPKWEAVRHERLVVVEPGVYNNEGPMPDGSYHSHFAYLATKNFEELEGRMNYQLFQNMGQGKPSFYKSRTSSAEMPLIKTSALNLNKTFLRSELGYGMKIRQRFQEAQSSNTLDLSGMDLDHIPPMVYDLEKLYVLNLAGNRIDFLPPRITELKALEKLELEGNPILNLPQGILIEGGMRDIRNYFESLETVSLDEPVILSIYSELDDVLKDLPKEMDQLLSPYLEEELLVTESLIDPTTDEIFRLFHKHRNNEIALLNISANTNRDTIVLLNPAGEKVEFSTATLVNIMGDLTKIKLVVMDGSESDALAKKLTEKGISASIGVEGGSTTAEAMKFWKLFYGKLANGQSLRQAFDQVKADFETKTPDHQQQTR